MEPPPAPAAAPVTSSATQFSAANYFPTRRRVQQACLTCSARKSRCDGARPRCSTCARLGLECSYKEAAQPRIEQNTRVLLERIQLLEERILGAVEGSGGGGRDVQSDGTRNGFDETVHVSAEGTDSSMRTRRQHVRQKTTLYDGVQGSGGTVADIQVSLSHTANSNHVFEWPIVRQLLGEDIKREHADATHIFFQPPSQDQEEGDEPPDSWHLFQDIALGQIHALVAHYRDLVHIYFVEVNLFFPVLSLEAVLRDLDKIAARESGGGGAPGAFLYNDDDGSTKVSTAVYARLLLVLTFGAFVRTRRNLIRLQGSHEQGNSDFGLSSEELWAKAKLLLGWISAELTLEAAQCSMVASLYCGARGQVAESFYHTHATAVKCEALARRTLISTPPSNDRFSDAFRRLYWVAFIYEGDFGSEISLTLPSGIAKFEDDVPYPTFSTPEAHGAHGQQQSRFAEQSTAEPSIIAFQISTNASIRRFLNRVNSVVYDSKEQHRMARPDYATWLLRVTGDLWSHHSAVYRNLPEFLLTAREAEAGSTGVSPATTNGASPSTPGFIRSATDMGNNPWNVIRLRGRYYAGQYIIHRPFMEFVLRNLSTFDIHPSREAVLEKCQLCFDGCVGFIRVFDVDPANSVTGLFASGMVHFTMVIILRVATIVPAFRYNLPADIEEAIFLGMQNLYRFAKSVREFEWHLSVLERLEQAKSSMS